MARVRLIGSEPVTVPELGQIEIQPDQVVEVPDARFEGFVCQPGAWEPVEEPKSAAVKKTAAKPQKEG